MKYATHATPRTGLLSWPAALLLPALLSLLFFAGGCAATEGASDRERPVPRDPARTAVGGPTLATPDTTVRTIQLYAGEDERRLPILTPGGRLTLEFDLMEERGRPLSVYFYHADREWRLDAAPARFIDGFRSAEIFDYTGARSRGVPYVHYTYRFPERNVGFEASGNYLLRVTEEGEEDEVLFERPFFVAEEVGNMELSFEELRRGTRPGLSDRPTVRYRPPPALGTSSFDFAACFVPNGQLRQVRCVERPERAGQPVFIFELPYDESFAPGTEDFFLDLSNLGVGGEIADVDRSSTPYRVRLEADFADFAGTGRPPLFLNDQPVVRGSGLAVSDPELSAEYVSVRFRFVPPNRRPLRGPVVVTGSFHEGALADAPRLRWRTATGRYEGDLLLKQGLYTYRYASPDPDLRRALARSSPSARRQYAAFVYYRDASLGSDRLLLVRQAQVE